MSSPTPDWEAIKDKRMCDLTPAQQEDAREALAAQCKRLVDEYGVICSNAGRGAGRDQINAAIAATCAAIDRLAALTEQPAAPTEPDDYGHTEHLCFAGVPMSDAAKRLGSMLVKAFGPRHPAVDDFAALALATQPAAPQAEPLTDEQIEVMFRSRAAVPAAGQRDDWYWYAWGVNDGRAAPAQEPQQPEQAAQALADELVTELLAASSPAPAVQPCAKILDHKWLDPECVETGCQSLVAAEAVAELVDVLKTVVAASGLASAAIAKHGQPQGGSNV